ncbi:MAG TPA: MFS transporter [Urbifossiella sp.]|nr:MFS transporter [Urbifossiella sp.]
MNSPFARWRIVLLLAGMAFLAHFNRVSISVAGSEVFIGEGKLSTEQMGWVYSIFLLVYTIGMLPGGLLIDRIGPQRALAGLGLGLGFWSAATGFLGWSGLSIAAMLVPLLVIRGLAGAASVPLHPAAARAVSLWLPVRERSTANGLITAGAVVGIALCYRAFGFLIERVGWPAAFGICGGVLFLYGLLWYQLSSDAGEYGRGSQSQNDVRLRDLFGLFRNRSLVLLTLSYGALSYVQYLYFYWIEFYFKNELKVSIAESRDAAFTVTLTMAVGMFLGGTLADRLARRLGHSRSCRTIALTGMGLTAIFSLAGLATPDARMVTIWFSLSLGSLGICEAIFWTTAPMLDRRGALACALVNTGGNGVGALAPILTPILGAYYDWNFAIVAACAICGVGGMLWLGIDADRHSNGPRQGLGVEG